MSWESICTQPAPPNADTSLFAVYSFGDGLFGALSLQGEGILEDAYAPTAVSGLPLETVGIAAGHYQSFAITEGGRLWAWGRNKEGQLGRAGASGENEGGWCVTYMSAPEGPVAIMDAISRLLSLCYTDCVERGRYCKFALRRV
jgi:hypothetical protein